ncbi:helix-turn-helix domain-containing protein [Shewanella psychropiezotolerans]|uniref:Helix-turn-helix domain-containing protein n=1 Tax=Shewanella psychropiezotolerans TaxID=2593655 RepID=A0ABX5WTJ0_9GAMM|nr:MULTISPECIES: helix-turn-helix domain-containing protein [Shewanella]MPY24436.1 helix-turn-helix domain-containing protein [Shewanella sp. YLB-07]QDO82403.1 helix-turn-helix domain-containing protein [Shewanella psychropiezotolerans]
MSDILNSLRDDLEGLVDERLVDQITLREFDKSNLIFNEDITADEIKNLRIVNHISQAVLAETLNISPVSVQRWERGVSKPTGPAVVLLNIIKSRGLKALMA